MTEKEERKRQKGFLPFVVSIGEKVANLFIMQLLFILFSLKGVVILGVFPAIASLTKLFIDWFITEDDSLTLFTSFNKYWSEYFKKANQIGYTLLFAFGFLFVDLRINETYIQSSVLHTVLLIIIFILGFLTVYTFPILVGHSLSYKDTLKQSFYVSLSTPIFTIAAVLGLALAFELSRYVVFIGLFFGMPLIVLPVAWFAYSGLKKIDEIKETMKVEERQKAEKQRKKEKSLNE